MARIVMIGPAHPYRGGLASYNERLAEEFIAQGHDVVMHTFKMQYPKILYPGKSQIGNREKPKHLAILRTINTINPLNWIKVGLQLRKLNPDFVFLRFWLPFFGPCYGTILRILKFRRKAKTVCLIDNIIPHEKRIGDKFFTKYFIKPIDGFVAQSAAVREDFYSFNSGKKCVLSPHPLFENFGSSIDRETAKRHLGISGEKIILFFGYIREYKGLDIILDAMKTSEIKEAGIKLIVAGEYFQNEEYYAAWKDDPELSKSVIWKTDFIPDEEVKNYFSAANALVLPYKSATQSGVTQIAFGFGTPMIISKVGGLPEVVPHEVAGLVAEPNADAFKEAVLRFFNENLSEELSRGVLKEKDKYTWDKMALAHFNALN